jgi:stearoyl-CoA desaturase (delta-9 desaturase)
LWFEGGIALVLLMVPLAGVVIAIPMFRVHGISPLDLTILAGMYLLTAFGITVGFHRLLTHHSFSTPDWLRALFAIAGSMALQGPVARWVADHRRHHAHTDGRGDPHSPRVDPDGRYSGHLLGLWHAHCGWFFNAQKTRIHRFAPDLLADPLIRRIDRWYALWALLSLGIPPAIGALVTGTSSGAWSAFIWGSLVRVFLWHHVTWSVNSICHWIGTRPFDLDDDSTNCWWLALPTLGEAWHNGHHAFPTSAVHGLQPGQVDVSAMLIGALAAAGLATDVKRPSPQQVAARARSQASTRPLPGGMETPKA